MYKNSGSTSTKTGIAPAASIAATVATAVWETVITSSPGPIFNARKANSIASVPLATPIAGIHSNIVEQTLAPET